VFGWWNFLGKGPIQKLHRERAERFSVPGTVITVYTLVLIPRDHDIARSHYQRRIQMGVRVYVANRAVGG